MSKLTNAFIIDPYSHGSFHEVINQSYIMMIASLYEHITYIADISSCNCLKKLMNECNFDYSNVTFIEKHFFKSHTGWAGLDALIDMLIVGWLDYYYYMKTPKDTDVFYNSTIYIGVSLICNFSFGKNNRVFDMCHSDMECIIRRKDDSIPMRLYSWYLHHIFVKKRLPKKMNFILLSSDMVTYFNRFINPHNRNRIFAIDHAYIRPKNKIVIPQKNDNTIEIGIPGAISPNRCLKTLQHILNELNNIKIKIYALSYVSGEIIGDNYIELNKTGCLMPFEEYNANVQKMDIMLFLYSKDSYKLTASGAILEAIWNEKPIIALENGYFRYLFNKFGDLGILCQSMEELVSVINKINNYKDFDKYLINIKYAKDQLSPSIVKNQLKKILV